MTKNLQGELPWYMWFENGIVLVGKSLDEVINRQMNVETF